VRDSAHAKKPLNGRVTCWWTSLFKSIDDVKKKMEFTGARGIPLKHDCLFVLFHLNTKRNDFNLNCDGNIDAAEMRIIKVP
jgi:hypothetical protein